jgi:hypothetical protein
MGIREIEWEGVDWIHLAHDRDQWQALENMVLIPSGSINFQEFLD